MARTWMALLLVAFACLLRAQAPGPPGRSGLWQRG
jgi:hypothetical protein